MLGAIIGDIIGSTYEFNPIRTKDFELFPHGSSFTDDTVLTIATADALLHGKFYADVYKEYPKKYPNRGYGHRFFNWVHSNSSKPYNSLGNGSAMRISPIGWAFENLNDVLIEATKSAEVTHNHPEGIKGAKAVASAIFLARNGKDKSEIRNYLESEFGYNLSHSIDKTREQASWDETCIRSVPEAIICFLESESFEDAIRNAISLGADADTQACIAGAIAEAYYGGIPKHLKDKVVEMLDDNLYKMTQKFTGKFILK